MPPRPRWIAPALTAAGSAALALAFALGALEVWCRATGRGRLQGAMDQGLNTRPSHFRLAANPHLGWELDPENYAANQAGTPLNSLGLPGPERGVRKPAGTYRIAVLGDSITEHGWYVAELERLLEDSGLGRRFEAWNWGVGGYSVTQYYHLLMDKVWRTSPDLVIIGFCLNDFTDAPVVLRERSGGFVAFRNPLLARSNDVAAARRLPFSRLLLLRSYAYRWLVPALALEPTLEPEDAARLGAAAVGRIAEECRRRGVPLLAVIIPFLYEPYRADERIMYERMKKILAAGGVPTLDLHGIFPRPGEPRWRNSPEDRIHPSKEGHRLIARAVYERLLAEGVGPSRGSGSAPEPPRRSAGAPRRPG